MRSSWTLCPGRRGTTHAHSESHIRAYIDDLPVVAHTLQDFAEGVEAFTAYLGIMGMELDPRKCAMATTRKPAGLHLRLCRHLANP